LSNGIQQTSKGAMQNIYSRSVLLLMVLIHSSSAQPDGPRAGRAFDLQGFIDGELAADKKRIVIPPGRYRVTPRKRQHLLLADLDGVEIIAKGVEMVCSETTRALTIHGCTNTTLVGMTIDYDPLPYTQGEIVKISPDGLAHDIELFKGYATTGTITASKYEIFRADTRTLRAGSYYGCKLTVLSPGKLRVVKPKHYRNAHPEQVGDIIATTSIHAPGGSIPHAIFLAKSTNVRLEGITLYASNCFGFLEVECSGTVYRKCIIDRRPAATDLKDREDPRIRSLNADAYHSKHAEVGPSYIECQARFQGDDCVAINGDYHMVMTTEGTELRVLAKRGLNIAKGDPVELVSYEGMRLPDGVVVSVKPDGEIKEAEAAFLRKQRMNANLKSNHHGALTKAFRIVIDRPVSLPMGSVICSANRVGNGFKVIDCEFGFNRSRGILVKASKGEIRGNLLDHVWMHAISLSPEWWWLEAGSGSDIVIRDNVIKGGHGRAIIVSAKGGSGKIPQAGAHRNITIVGNRIEDCPTPQILVTSTAGLVITGNTISGVKGDPLPPEQAIEQKSCTNTTVKDNVIE
jgi:hypothetical protein